MKNTRNCCEQFLAIKVDTTLAKSYMINFFHYKSIIILFAEVVKRVQVTPFNLFFVTKNKEKEDFQNGRKSKEKPKPNARGHKGGNQSK